MALNLNLYKRNEENNDNLVIFIHGLGAPESTWKQDGISWIDLFLTDDEYKDLDVAEIIYDTSHLANGILSRMGLKKIKIGRLRSITVGDGPYTTIEILARELKREINSKRIKNYKTVILLGHSMGGLVAVRYVLEEIEHDYSHNIKGIISLATPYNGSSKALYSQLIKSINKHAQIPSLEPNSKFLDDTIRLWQKNINKITTEFKFFFGTEDNIVDENSAIPLVVSSKWEEGIPLPGDHSSILKVKNHSSPSYIHVSEAVSEIIEKDMRFKKKIVDEQRRLILAKCITRLKANGLNREQAKYLIENKKYNFEYLKPTVEKRLVVLVGDFGIGKSFAVDRINLDLLFRAEHEFDFAVPRALNAAQLTGDIQKYLEETVLDNNKEQWITVDGMDEVTLSISANILENMRIATERWRNLRVILTSRPLTIFNNITERIYIKGLSETDALELVSFVSPQQQNFHLHSFPKDIKDVIRRPLFAILLGLYLNRMNNWIPTTSGELLTFLIENALEKVEINEPRINQLLINLAMTSTSKGNVPVKKSEIGDINEIKNLLNSGIVVEENGYLSFVLPILSQWFAAKALSENVIEIKGIIVRNQLDYWKYPLIILITMFKESKVESILSEIVEKDSGFAAIIIEKSINKWGEDEHISNLTAHECASKIRMAMSFWVKSLGELAFIIAPLTSEKNILPIGVKKEKGWLMTSWYQGKEEISEINIINVKRFDQEWPIWRGASPGSGSSWYWKWTLEELKGNLSEKIKNKSLPICTDIIFKELMWSATLKITKKGSLYTNSIPISEINARLDSDYCGVQNIGIERNLIPLSIYRNYINILKTKGILILESPLLGRDIDYPKDNWVWSSYSDERLYNRTLQIYREVIIGYRELVETLFPVLKKRLRKYVLYPFILKGKFEAPEILGSRSIGPGLKWFLEPLPSENEDFILDIKMNTTESEEFDRNIFNEIDKKIKEYRPESSDWLSIIQTDQVLDIFGPAPVTDTIYAWLESDLKSINWIK